MIFWRGCGPLAIIIVAASACLGFGLCVLLAPTESESSVDHIWLVPAAIGLGSLLLWPIGLSLSRNGSEHSLQFVPLHWWGIGLPIVMAFVVYHMITHPMVATSIRARDLAKPIEVAAEPMSPMPRYYLKSPINVTNPQGNLKLPTHSEVQFGEKDGPYYIVKSGTYKFKLNATQLDIIQP